MLDAQSRAGVRCAEAGTCDPDFTVADTLERDLGFANFTTIYAMSQDIVHKINAGDWQGLQQYLETER